MAQLSTMTHDSQNPPQAAYSDLVVRLANAARDADRDPEDIRFVAVSKRHDAERIRPVLQAGHRVFGENRVQEAQTKWPPLRAEFPDIELHLVGALQSNKATEAVQTFDAIHSVDREKLATALAREIDRQGAAPDLFVQVNTGEEPQKSGVLPADADRFIAHCRDVLDLPVRGLMCLPPQDDEPSLHFALLRKIAERNGLVSLSMGMSSDFEIAIAFGATHIRVGEALFGPRPPVGASA